ncbi:MAG TPA: STAS domain-containing protein [Pseudonocardiaceae bacterium]|nr:STAS domain-containing protein [Pseudonocardiaceae bacterium]
MTHAFSVTTRSLPTAVVLTIRGDLDAATAPEVHVHVAGLALPPDTVLVVDLAELRFCDSSGIAALIAAHNVAQTANAYLTLAAVPPQLSRALGMIGLTDFFITHPTTERALATQPPPAPATGDQDSVSE